eukprot:scaffold91174_cov27-Prasinocladus_malaysianus.AAC.1
MSAWSAPRVLCRCRLKLAEELVGAYGTSWWYIKLAVSLWACFAIVEADLQGVKGPPEVFK